MTTYPHRLADLHDIAHRPGIRTRTLIGTDHGVESFFIDEFRMEQGAQVSLHTHPVEEAWVVTEGRLRLQVGDNIVNVEAESVVRIPLGVPHAVRNEGPDTARAIAGAPWNRGAFFSEGTRFLAGEASTTDEDEAKAFEGRQFRSRSCGRRVR
jgi:quercetin dioxygenase-like cupin family protein